MGDRVGRGTGSAPGRVRVRSGDASGVGGGAQSWLREANERRVVDALRSGGALSQAAIARGTGLSAATVSNIVRRLSERGDLTVSSATSSGRRSTAVRLSRQAGVAVGIDFGHSHLRVAVADLSHEVLAEDQVALDVDLSADGGMRAAGDMVRSVLATAGASGADVVGVGMGVPGPVDSETGSVGSTSILPGWVGVNAARTMESLLGFPVIVDNDANLGALAETVWGAARGSSDVAYIKAATGIGGGLVLGGRLHRGHAGTAGEIGHVVIDEAGRLCRCGNRGCLETLAGGPALLEMARAPFGEPPTLQDLVARALAGEVGCRRVLGDAGRAIGVAVAGLCNLISPELVVVGGDLSVAGDLLLEPLRTEIARYAIPATARRTTVRAGALGPRAEVLGAVALVLDVHVSDSAAAALA